MRTRSCLPAVVRTAPPMPPNDLCSVPPFLDKLRDYAGRILQIAGERGDGVAAGVVDARRDRRMGAEIS